MRTSILCLAAAVGIGIGAVQAQDSRHAPKGQQIPGPECLNMKGAWEGGSQPCRLGEHEAWLVDVTLLAPAERGA